MSINWARQDWKQVSCWRCVILSTLASPISHPNFFNKRSFCSYCSWTLCCKSSNSRARCLSYGRHLQLWTAKEWHLRSFAFHQRSHPSLYRHFEVDNASLDLAWTNRRIGRFLSRRQPGLPCWSQYNCRDHCHQSDTARHESESQVQVGHTVFFKWSSWRGGQRRACMHRRSLRCRSWRKCLDQYRLQNNAPGMHLVWLGCGWQCPCDPQWKRGPLERSLLMLVRTYINNIFILF